jgi:hypothetical protein
MVQVKHTWTHSECIQVVYPLRADLGVASLHHDMVQRDSSVTLVLQQSCADVFSVS